MDKILFIFFYYDDKYASGVQNKRLIEGIRKDNTAYRIICRHTSNVIEDDSVQVSVPRLSLLNNALYKIFPFLIGIISFDELYWIIKVIIYTIKHEKDFTHIHISSSPFFIQLIGYYFKRKRNACWIAQFLDPVLDNSYVNYSRKSAYCLKKIENLVVKNADLVLVNNDRIKNRITERYPSKQYKISVVPLMTDSNIITSSERNEKITLIHSGNLYGLRKVDYVIRGLDLLRKQTKSLHRLEIIFIGEDLNNERKKVRLNGFEEIIHFRDYVPRAELYQILGKADALLSIDALGIEGMFFPTKLCEYFSFQKIIFAITSKESAIHDVLSKSGHICFDEGEEEMFAAALNSLIENRSNYLDVIKKDIYKEYLPTFVGEKYLQKLCRS